MVKRKINWSSNALMDLLEIIQYYNNRNKSKIYSTKLNSEIKLILKTIDFTVSLPQKTAIPNLFYFTHKHITVCFEIHENELKIQLVIDDRRNPQLINRLLINLD
jgi:toxin YoeB